MKLPVKNKVGGNCDFMIEEAFGGTNITLIYAPRNKMIELTKYREWIESFGERRDLERFTVELWQQLEEQLKPMFLQLSISRGGLTINKPPLFAPPYDPACFQVKNENNRKSNDAKE